MVKGVLSTGAYTLPGGKPATVADIALDPLFTAEVVSKVKALLQQGLSSGEKIGVWEQVLDECVKAGVAWDVHVPPNQTGVHPGNRSSFGVSGHDSQHLGFKILSVGWSWAKCTDATAVQAPPAPLDKQVRIYNDELVALSDGLLPPLKVLQALTIGGGHTNCFLRQVQAGVRCILPESKFCDKATGTLNADLLKIGRPGFAEALAKGLKYRMFHWQAPIVFPELVDFAQSSLNTTVSGEQTEIEILLRLHQLAAATAARGQEISWRALEEQACSSMPQCASWIKSLSAYVDANSGGDSGKLLHDLALFAKAFGTTEQGPSRILGSEFLNKLASMNFGTGQHFPYLINACIETNLVSPPNRIIDGMCRLLVPSNLTELTKASSRIHVKFAEEIMTQARELCDKLQLDQTQRIKLIGKLDVRIVTFLTKKGKELEPKEFKSINDIVEAFIETVSAINGKKVSFTGASSSSAGEAAPSADSAPVAAAQAPASSLQSVEQLQSKVFQAQRLGFKDNTFVSEKSADEPILWHIIGYNGDTVNLAKHDLGRLTDRKTVHVDDLLSQWRLHKGSVTVLLPEYSIDNDACSPLSSSHWLVETAKGAVHIAVRTVFEHMFSMGTNIDVFTKPCMVRAGADIPTGALMIAPATTRVERKDVAHSINVGRFELGGGKAEPLFIAPMFIPPVAADGQASKNQWVSIFWLVNNANVKKDANLALKCLVHSVNDTQVRVPILVNSKPIQNGEELLWDKASAKSFSSMRSVVTMADCTKAAKRRKID